MVKVLAEVTGSISFSQRGEKGEKGDNGVGVKDFNTYYGLSSSKSSPPTTYNYDTLSETIISQNSEKYVWSADKVLYTDGTGGDFINAYCIGKCSDLTSVKEQYGTSTSAGTKPSSWGYSYPSNPANGTYVWSRDEIVWAGDNSTTHSDAQLIGYIAVNGATGNGIKSTEVTYQIWNSGTTPPKDEEAWSTRVPNITDEKPYLWTRTIFKYTNGGSSNPSYSVATRGTKGALMREHDGFESGKYKYLSGSGAEEYIDVVCINGKWWQCIVTYDDKTDTPSLDDGHWKEMNNYKSIATHLLLAENATINMLGTNQINLFNPTDTTNRKMYGSFRVVKDVNDWSLWLGGKDGDSASFAVRRNGYLKATDADISGRINATSGSVGGFNIGDNAIGTFDGSTGAGFNQNYMQFTGSEFFHGQGYFIACGNYAGKGLYIDSTVSSSNNLCAGIQVRVSAGDFAPSDPVDSGNMCTALDLFTQWTGQTGSFDVTNAYEGNHAIVIRGGDVIGLRPSFVRIAASYELTEYNHTIECYNTSTITLTLPSSPKYGQCYTIIQRGGRVNISSDINIYDTRNTSSATTWYSDTRGQVSWIWYNGIQWIVSYATR